MQLMNHLISVPPLPCRYVFTFERSPRNARAQGPLLQLVHGLQELDLPRLAERNEEATKAATGPSRKSRIALICSSDLASGAKPQASLIASSRLPIGPDQWKNALSVNQSHIDPSNHSG